MERIKFKYKNHRGEVAERTVEPFSLTFYTVPSPEYGHQPGWFLTGLDFTGDRDGVPRSFALVNIQMPMELFDMPSMNKAFSLRLK